MNNYGLYKSSSVPDRAYHYEIDASSLNANRWVEHEGTYETGLGEELLVDCYHLLGCEVDVDQDLESHEYTGDTVDVLLNLQSCHVEDSAQYEYL